MDENELDEEIIYSREKSLAEVVADITGEDPDELERRVAEYPIPDFDELIPDRKE
jgi:hypothetical protein